MPDVSDIIRRASQPGAPMAAKSRRRISVMKVRSLGDTQRTQYSHATSVEQSDMQTPCPVIAAPSLQSFLLHDLGSRMLLLAGALLLSIGTISAVWGWECSAP